MTMNATAEYTTNDRLQRMEEPISPMSISSSFSSSTSDLKPKNTTTSTFKLETQAFMIPHPSKVEKGGEDAYFVSADGKALGVADGVGGWSMHGIDPAIYAKSMMKDSKIAYDEMNLKIPSEMLAYAYERAKVIQGSSTACILVLNGQTLQTLNIGDSGFLVIRDGKILHRFKEQLHSFNYPFQLGTASANVPEDASYVPIEVKDNDIAVVGSDGLFDNLFDGEILDIVLTQLHSNENISETLAKTAYMKSQSSNLETPFRRTACELGLVDSPFGGKLDDITVLVSRVSSRNIPSELNPM